MHQLHQPLNVVDSWAYYEFEDYMKLLNDRNEEERKQREEEQKQYKSNSDYNNIIKNTKLPSINIPNNYKL